MHLAEAVLGGDDEGLGQIIAGHNAPVALCPGQKFPCALGGGCVVHMENAHNGVRPHGHIVTNVQVQFTHPLRITYLLPIYRDSLEYIPKSTGNPVRREQRGRRTTFAK